MTIHWNLSDTQPVFDRAQTALQSKTKGIRNLLITIGIFCAVLLVGLVTQIIATMNIQILLSLISLGGNTAEESVMVRNNMVQMLYLCVFAILLGILYCVGIERRTIRSMGFTKHHAVSDYLIGLVVGALMMGASVWIAYLGGGLEYRGIQLNGQWGLLALFFGGWLIQGLSEEVSFRGYLMMSLSVRHHRWLAVIISSLVFAAAHLGNDGITFFSVCNLTLYGLFAALYFLRFDSIWGIGALHSMWNCAQGNLFGIKVSGMEINTTVFSFQQTADKAWLHGGSFGLEGGAAVTIVLLLGCLILLLIPQRKPRTAVPLATD